MLLRHFEIKGSTRWRFGGGVGHQLEKWKSMLKKKDRKKNQGGSTKWQSRADNGCCHLAVTLSNLKEQRSLETRRGATAAAAAAGCTIHPNNQFHFFLPLLLLTLPHSFLLTPSLMSPLWSYSSITDGGCNDVGRRARTRVHTQPLDLSFHRQRRSQEPKSCQTDFNKLAPCGCAP